MTITNLTFTHDEAEHVLQLAAEALLEQELLSDRQIKRRLQALSPPNILRLALGLPLKSRGGARLRAGRPKTTTSKYRGYPH